MKKILFLIIGTLLVLGLVLPGCGNGAADFDQYITIGIAGPMGAAQGDHHWYGANLAADEINDDGNGGLTVGGLVYGIDLIKIATNEILNPSGADGVTRMLANVAACNFFMGGFRTEAVKAYRDVAMDAGKLFIDCGAATEILQRSCVLNYTYFKPWFKGTPPNEVFLQTSSGKLLNAIIGTARAYSGNDTYMPTIAFMAENAEWTDLSVLLTVGKFGPGGEDLLVGPSPYVWLPSPVATPTEMDTILDEIDDYDPDVILTLLSGPCGATYAQRVGDFMPDVLSAGINVEAQRDEFADLKWAEGIITLDSWAPGINYTDKTADFVSDFVAEYGENPIYTAATYDALLALAEALEDKNSLTTADMIAWFEDVGNAREGTSGVSGYYPQWNGSLYGTSPVFGPAPALTQTQVLALYPWLANAKFSDGATVSNWTYSADDWTMPMHDTHDLVYGTKWVTGAASQWQDDAGTLKKVGIWPMKLKAALPDNLEDWMTYYMPGVNASTMFALQEGGLWDQYGWWNFAYEGTVAPVLADWIAWIQTKW